MKKRKKEEERKESINACISPSGYLEFAVDLGEANLGGILESSIGFPEGIKRPHLQWDYFVSNRRREEREREGRDGCCS